MLIKTDLTAIPYRWFQLLLDSLSYISSLFFLFNSSPSSLPYSPYSPSSPSCSASYSSPSFAASSTQHQFFSSFARFCYRSTPFLSSSPSLNSLSICFSFPLLYSLRGFYFFYHTHLLLFSLPPNTLSSSLPLFPSQTLSYGQSVLLYKVPILRALFLEQRTWRRQRRRHFC